MNVAANGRKRAAAVDAMRKIQQQLDDQGGIWEDPNAVDKDVLVKLKHPVNATSTGKRRRTLHRVETALKDADVEEDQDEDEDEKEKEDEMKEKEDEKEKEQKQSSINANSVSEEDPAPTGDEVDVVPLRAHEADAATLENEGFKVFRSAYTLPRRRMGEWKKLVKHQGNSIFNGGDTRRRQARVVPPDDLKAVAARVAPHLNANEWVVLQSAPGCSPQPPHCDWNPHAVSDAVTEVPCGLLIATMPETPLDVWPGSWRHVRTTRDVKTEDYRQVTLGAGDAVLFRADLVHAGAEWSFKRRRSNVRVHAFLDAPGVVRKDDYTFRINSM